MPEIEDADRTMCALQEEIRHLKRAVLSHAVVDQAIGVVVAHGRLTPETAWTVLKEVSQHTNTKLREVAEHLVRWPHSGRLPPRIDHALRSSLERHTHTGPARERAVTTAVRTSVVAQPRRVFDGLVP
ncbi:ANTAR domain-containing protein [Streptomyces sp. NPDC048219]|uniref:ANTAR domain-containing protein n=1 Tax=unclassified Streptomyces TaxID=2593676 RepID=UPI00343483F2